MKKYKFVIPQYKTETDESCHDGRDYIYDLETEGDTLEELYNNCRVYQLTRNFNLVTSYKECGPSEKKAISFWYSNQRPLGINSDLDKLLKSAKGVQDV